MSPLDGSLQYFLLAEDVGTLLTVLHLAVCDEVTGCEPGLATGGHEDDDWLAIAEFLDVVEG